MNNKLFVKGSVFATLVLHLTTSASAQFLGSAQAFAVLAGSTVTSTGLTVVNGDLGVWPGTAVTGFPPGIVNGTIHLGNAVAQQAQVDVCVAYDSIVADTFDTDLTGLNLGGLTLNPGVYHFNSSAFLTGNLILDAQGDPNARFDFQIGSTLITANQAQVTVINGGSGQNVYWQVGSSATLGTNTDFAGNILAQTSITLTTGASITDGRALARNGAVTMDSNQIVAVPEPASLIALATGTALFISKRRRKI